MRSVLICTPFANRLTDSHSRYIISCMRLDSRLSGVLHLLLHMLEENGAMTSEALAKAMETNAVVVRRVMSGLRESGLVRSSKGHGGGWEVACDPAATSLLDIYRALGEPTLFAITHRQQAPKCLVEQSVNSALEEALNEAQSILLSRFGKVTLAEISADFHRRMRQRKSGAKRSSHAP